MSKAAASNVFDLPPSARRLISPLPKHLTCLVLIRHAETPKALLVSDTGDSSKAVWCPKTLLIIEATRGNILVAKIPKVVAEHKRLSPYATIDPSWWSAEEIELLREASAAAARIRNQLRGCSDPLPYPGRNAFA